MLKDNRKRKIYSILYSQFILGIIVFIMGDRGYFIYIYISSWNDLLIRPLEFGQFTTLQNMGVKIINFFYVFGLR